MGIHTTLRLLVATLASAVFLGACGAASFNSDEGRDAYRACMRQADALECEGAAQRLETGDEAQVDLERALELYERACRIDASSGCRRLGEFLLRHHARLDDASGAVDRIERACKTYDVSACHTLVLLHRTTDGPAYDMDRSEAVRLRMCELSFVSFCWVDTDGDGIGDDDDACPEIAEDADEFEDANGCPDPDNDGDGILDGDDTCPLDAEDTDGFEDADGCPDLDNDADGILDGDDACRDEAEDIDSFEDMDGCPDPDNDGDGILDGIDACPIDAEDIDGFEDADGCPEEGEGLVALTCDAIEIRESVFFDTNSDVIQDRSFPLLTQVAGVLTQFERIRLVEVAGHTDDRGRDAANLDLSQRRAASVMTFLTTQGVAAERLRAQGYGETAPIQPNTTAEGRAANRRVEFRIVQQDQGCGTTAE